ncbi:ATP phosphoribosyltransferase regulatory subunit [Paraclostridium bifermentans]|uniref:ATP phosphoribosyltransferase regulatory subunit n=1 Tax=Paraclostridium bifermentans TaxID=1490 RepID=UPI002FCCC2C0
MVGDEKSSYLTNLLNFKESNEILLDKLMNLNIQNEFFSEGLDELKKVVSTLKILGVKDNEFEVDLKIIRGLDYYTGSVFETFLIGNEQFGSICSGGRYDNLAENYTNNILPGVGISIGLTRLFFVLKEIGFIDKYNIKSNSDYLIIPIGDTLEYSGKVMSDLNEKGYNVSIYFEDDSLKKKLSYANKLNIDNVIFIGESEVVNNEIKIKNMISGEEKIINYKDL